MKCQDFFENFSIFFYSLKLPPFRDNKRPVKQILTQKLVPEKPESKKLKDKASKKKKKNAPDAKKEQGADK